MECDCTSGAAIPTTGVDFKPWETVGAGIRIF